MVLFVMVISTGSVINALFGFLIIINSGIGIVQELRAKKTLDNLAVVGEGKPLVRRDACRRGQPRQMQTDPGFVGQLKRRGDGYRFGADRNYGQTQP